MDISVQHHALERQLLRCTAYKPTMNSNRLDSPSTRDDNKKDSTTKESSHDHLLRSGSLSTIADGDDNKDPPRESSFSTSKIIANSDGEPTERSFFVDKNPTYDEKDSTKNTSSTNKITTDDEEPKKESFSSEEITTDDKNPRSDSSSVGDVIDCGCPNTCKGVALRERRNALDYTCQDRIEHLMKRYGLSQRDACLDATAISEGIHIQACNPELCNPGACPVFNEKEKIELAKTKIRQIVVIATVPKDEKHATALWTELECITGGLDAVILSAPIWSREITEGIATRARNALGWDEETLQTRYYVNDRWDAGLWCDVLHDIDDLSRLESIVLVNDSVFVMRKFSGIQDTLAANTTLDMVGLSWSHTYSSMLTDDRFWLERYAPL